VALVEEQSPEPKVRFDRLFRALERPFLLADAAIGRVLPPALNPLARTGAIAFLTFIVAVVSGIPLLFWYVPSSVHAHASLAGIADQPVALLLRTLHRTSSDACLLFTALHGVRLLVARRTAGQRWLAWVTGVALVGLLWLVGWLGYWLMWDERARQVALGTARLADRLPIFAEPLSLSFVTDDAVRPLLFFVVFFLHMLLPLAMGILLWLHLARLQRPRWRPVRALITWTMGGLIVLSIVLPADLAAPAQMTVTPRGFAIDAWYLAPLWLTDRLGSGWLWTASLGLGALAFAVPWLLVGRRRAAPAAVIESRCNACNSCINDCPYGAIELVPRQDGKALPGVARVDPARCVGCGICTGSCDSNGIDVPILRVQTARPELDHWLDAARKSGEAPIVAFACASSAAARLAVEPTSGRAEALPGAVVVAVPCAGWVHPLLIERCFRHGAASVVIVACDHGEPMYREGPAHTAARLAGERVPALRPDKVDPGKIELWALPRSAEAELTRRFAALRATLDAEAGPGPRLGREATPPASRRRRIAVGALLTVVSAAVLGAGSVVPYRLPDVSAGELVIAAVHPGKIGEHCRETTAEERAAQPVHMRQAKICERGRAPVRVRVTVDGQVLLNQAYRGSGLFSDGASVVHARLALAPGPHEVVVELDDGVDPNAWGYVTRERIEAKVRHASVVRFERGAGFVWTR
jgi:ferredoxin/coenzyme F420-reducing hydrogenase delta subunit